MIAIYVILAGLFLVLSVVSYHFSKKTYIAYTDDTQNIRVEHRLYHMILSTLMCITTSLLSILYMSCVLFSVVFVEYIEIVPTLLIIKHVIMVMFVSSCLLSPYLKPF